MKKTIRINDETDQLVKDMSRQLYKTESAVIDEAIRQFASGVLSRESNASAINQPIIDLLEEQTKRLKVLEENNGHLLNLVNSLVTHLNFDDYMSAAEQPHSWLKKSREQYKDRILRRQTTNLLKG
ncbi:MAG: hypothetical protein QM689_01680 [Oscillospiraceae bacterium]